MVAIEDLVPLAIGVAAVKRYAEEFLGPAEAAKLAHLRTRDVNFEGCSGTHDAPERAAAAKLEGFHLDKVGFARSVLEAAADDETLTEAAETMEANFRVLFRVLGRRQRQAMREVTTEKTSPTPSRSRR
ncbi:hypothetical protein AB0M54_32420 [Actinoplanes sp. NPDC051470]|uniref:hypothetical protein n=1 Tax=Actinoplanes sp. NPDC051470 TaxID=3157224 RepID=UPI0034410244